MPPAGSRPCRIGECEVDQLRAQVEAGPEADADAPSRFRLCDIRKWILESFGVHYPLEGVRKLLRRLGFRRMPPRPLHRTADLAAQDEFRNNFSELAKDAAGGATGPIEIGVQDESRVGQQGMLSRIWARKGHTTPDPPRLALRVLLTLLCRVPGSRAGRGACQPTSEHNRNEPALGRHQRAGRTRQPRRARP